MSFSQLGYPQFLSGSQEVYGGDRAGLGRDGGADGGVNQAATAAAVSSMLGMYGNPWAAQNYSAFLPYSGADLALISQMVGEMFSWNVEFKLRSKVVVSHVFMECARWLNACK